MHETTKLRTARKRVGVSRRKALKLIGAAGIAAAGATLAGRLRRRAIAQTAPRRPCARR